MSRGIPIHFRRAQKPRRPKYNGLTPGQQRIVALLSLSLKQKEIAEIIGRSLPSVHKTIERAMRRLNLSSSLQLVLWWDRNRDQAA
jgi:DNA-binding CsgD family transcriptional regulator